MRFSIIIPCLNRHEDLRAAVASCLNQTYADFELIVVDDGSNPPLAAICNDFADARIVVLRNESNRGVAASRNLGIEAAKGDYVSFLDSDDVYLPRRLEVMSSCLANAATPPDIVFHRQRRVLEPGDDGMISPARLPKADERLDDYILIWGNFIQTNSFAIERGLARRIKFDVQCKIYEDTKFLIECWLASPGYLACDEVLSVYHDFRLGSRLSKQRKLEDLRPMLLFTEQHCSHAAHMGFSAFTSAEISFFQRPGDVLGKIGRAYRVGVPVPRCAVYLLRSIFGTRMVDGALHRYRLLRRRRVKQVATRLRSRLHIAAMIGLVSISSLLLVQGHVSADETTSAVAFPTFAKESFWYQPIPKSAPLNDKSDEYAKEFADQVKTYYGHVGINTVNYSAPLYIVDSVAPSVRVSLWDCWKNGFRDAKLARDIAVVPIPAFAEASGGTDSEMAVYQTGTDTLWEFWKAQKVDGAWRACWGGRMPNVSSSSGIWRHPYGAAGTGLPFFAGQIQIQELQRGEINHVMGIALVRGLKGRFSWPANRSDGRAATGIPEGMRLRLDPSIDVDSLKLHPIARAIAKAAQTYGFVVWDMAGSVSLRAENPKPYTLQGKPNPYVKLFNGTPTYAVMNGFPWDRMQFMPENYGKE